MKILIIVIYTCLLIVPITSENDESDEFIPTSEWQTVKEGIFRSIRFPVSHYDII